MNNQICNQCGQEITIENFIAEDTHKRRISTIYQEITRLLCGCGCLRVNIQKRVRWSHNTISRTTVSLMFDNRKVQPFVNVI